MLAMLVSYLVNDTWSLPSLSRSTLMVMTRTGDREFDSEKNLRCSGKIRCTREAAFLPSLEYGVP